MDPLDPAELDEISKSEGDATGSSWTGLWTGEYEPTSCDCPELSVGDESFDPCTELAGARELELEVEQFGGLLVVRFEGVAEHTGPVEADDSFIVAAISDLSEAFGEAELLSRIDGDFADGDPESMDAVLHQRLDGEIGGDEITCEARGELRAFRTGDLP